MSADFRDLGVALRVAGDKIAAFGGELTARSAAFIATDFYARTRHRTGRARSSTMLSAGSPKYAPPKPGIGPFTAQANFGPAVRAIRRGSNAFVTQAARQKEGPSYSGALAARYGSVDATVVAFESALPGLATGAASAVGMGK